jgi:pimeloyl-ACP methyl ester carboxylesterase
MPARSWVLLLALTGGLCGSGAAQSDSARTSTGLWFAQQGQGDPLVLVHGSNLDSRSFDWIVGPLAARRRVVVQDLRFHGRSTDPGGPVSWERDLLEVLDALHLERASLLGHSLGAQVVVDFALAHPERVDRLVVVGPSVSGYVSAAMPSGFDAVLRAVRAGDPSGAAAAMAEMPAMGLVAAVERRPFVRQLFQDNAGLFRQDPARLERPSPPATERLERLAAPLLVLVGDSDLTYGPQVADLLVRRVHGARRVTLRRCGHLAPVDCPDQVIRAVEEFLQRE